MYKVLIADDEPIASRNLTRIIDNSFKEFHVEKIVFNGLDALSYIEKENDDIDVIFSDIKMPKLDGLAFFKEIHQKYPHIILIIISGYSDFSYARTAMQNGASDYLLKPLIPSRVRTVMQQIQQKLEDFYFLQRTNLIHSMDKKVNPHNKDLKKYFSHDLYYLAIVRINTLPKRYVQKEEIVQPQKSDNIFSFPGRDSRERVLIVPSSFFTQGNPRSYFRREMEKHNRDSFSTMVYDDTAMKIEALQERLPSLYKFLYESLTLERSQFLLFQQDYRFESSEESNCLVSQVINFIKRGDSKSAKEYIRKLFDCWKKNRPPQLYMENILRNILSNLLFNRCNELNVDSEYLLDDVFYYALTIENLENEFFTVFFNQIVTNAVMSKIDTPEFLKMITNYLDGHYQHQVNMERVCAQFGISQPYLSKLFRKYSNDTFNHYLTKIRMEKAQNFMIHESSLSIKDIAEMVGYQDQFYFSRVFSNYLGISPSNFIKQNQSHL